MLQSSISHPDLYEIMSQLIHLYDQIKSKALTRLQHDGLFNSSDVTDPSGKYFQDPTGFAMDRYAYYMCSKCQQVDKNIVILYLLFSFDIVIYNIFCFAYWGLPSKYY